MVDELKKSIEANQAALLVIDMQNDFCHEEGALARRGADISLIQQMVPNLLNLIEAASSVSLPTIYIVTTHDSWTDSARWVSRYKEGQVSSCRTGSWGAELYKMSPEEKDRVIIKHRYSAFVGTELDLILRSRLIRNLLITGVGSKVCVESTARDAFMRDYQLVLVEDCMAACTKEEHDSTVKTMAKYFDAIVALSGEIIERWYESGS